MAKEAQPVLRHLHITNVALIEECALDFGSGMTVLTGETGAGKSLVLDALGLLSGLRATPSLVRTGSDRAIVEAVFDAPVGSPAAVCLAEHGIEVDESGEVILRRELLASGRGRASINGRLAPVGQLAEVAATLLEINAQNDQQSLLDPATQREFYDRFAGLDEARGSVRKLWQEAAQAATELEALDQADQSRAQRADFLRFQVDELEALEPRVGELEELEAEARRLGSIELLQEHGAVASKALSGGGDDSHGACDLVAAAAAALGRMAAKDPEVQGLAERLDDIQSRLADATYDMERYLGSLETDPSRLNEIHSRCDALKKGLRKYGPTESEALARLEQLRAEFDSIDDAEGARRRAEERVAKSRAALAAAARDLSGRRDKARAVFLRPLAALLRDFAIPKVRVDIAFVPVSSGVALGDGKFCGASGAEEVEILFTANEGESLQPLRRVASGGELSRVMLALRSLDAGDQEGRLLVFDEVDAGISGAAARAVADRLAALGARCQLLCVTHNPSVAAAAGTHLVVEKLEAGGRTIARIAQAEGIARQRELARLLDGGKYTARGLALAEELLADAG